jgi:hypothetical protein
MFFSSILWITACGCSKSTGPEMFPVAGKILVQGKPASYAKLTFFPVDQDPKEYLLGVTAGEDGSFELGARKPPQGEESVKYEVAISWKIPKNPSSVNDPDYGNELLPPKFRNAKSSGVKVEITSEMTELEDIDLKP